LDSLLLDDSRGSRAAPRLTIWVDLESTTQLNACPWTTRSFIPQAAKADDVADVMEDTGVIPVSDDSINLHGRSMVIVPLISASMALARSF
jgi:hypothetical protein